MRIISHRGNTSGPNSVEENHPRSIESAIDQGFDVELDAWVMSDKKVFLGHDAPQFAVELTWLKSLRDKLWIHCKNVNALELFSQLNEDFVYFFHRTDPYTLVSNGKIWVYPGNVLPLNSIYVLPERGRKSKDKIIVPEYVYGVCTDFVYEIRNHYEK